MTQEEKQLLIKDLCARIPYGIKAKYRNSVVSVSKIEEDGTIFWFLDSYNYGYMHCSNIKLYLRPISSMTEKEKKEFFDLCTFKHNDGFVIDECCDSNLMLEKFDYLNAHYIDYRGLIGKGLALEAPENMYNN